MTASHKTQPHRSIAIDSISRATSPTVAAFKVQLAACLMFCSGIALAADPQWVTPHTSFGAPDFQGIWTNATITNLERPDALSEKRFYSEAEAEALEQRAADMVDRASQPSDPNAGAPTAGTDVGGYNRFWMDPGSRLALVNGEYRTSLVIEPANGQIPYTDAARQAIAAAMESRSRFDHPEQRPVNERCLVGFGSTGGPPMLPVLYNNMYQIVQVPGYVMILVEMNNDARIIRIEAEPFDSDFRRWLGDSVGYYDGDTLVVRTSNFNPYETYRVATAHRLYVGTQSVVTERFTRLSEDQIHYEFTVEDPQYYTQTWKGEFPFKATEDRMFEYACHEGNYALPGILAGGRVAERDQ